MPAIAIKADIVYPVSHEPIADGVVVIEDRRVVLVQNSDELPDSIPKIELPKGTVLLPGLVNSHTHLEFSSIENPLGEPGMGFTDWIGHVMKFRMSNDESDAFWKRKSIQKGLEELTANGIALAGEIATCSVSDRSSDRENNPYTGSLIGSDNEKASVIPFYELIGLSNERAADAKQNADRFLTSCELVGQNRQKGGNEGKRTKTETNSSYGLSPHAPYTCGCQLLDWAVRESSERRYALAMHLAETQAELELIENKTGDFRELLERVGVWNPDAFRELASVDDYLDRLRKSTRAILVHCNYLNEQQIEFIAQNREKMSVVFCPRTHAYFAHDRYPLKTMLDKGVCVALGTDSRASNPDLNVWSEAQFVWNRFSQEVDAKQIVKMVTQWGAEALGVESEFGSIQKGRKAVFSAFKLPFDERFGEPIEKRKLLNQNRIAEALLNQNRATLMSF